MKQTELKTSNSPPSVHFSRGPSTRLPAWASIFELLRWTTALPLSFWSHRLESRNLGWLEFMVDCRPQDYGMVFVPFSPNNVSTESKSPSEQRLAAATELERQVRRAQISENKELRRWVNGAAPPSHWRRRRSGKFQQSKVVSFSCSCHISTSSKASVPH